MLHISHSALQVTAAYITSHKSIIILDTGTGTHVIHSWNWYRKSNAQFVHMTYMYQQPSLTMHRNVDLSMGSCWLLIVSAPLGVKRRVNIQEARMSPCHERSKNKSSYRPMWSRSEVTLYVFRLPTKSVHYWHDRSCTNYHRGIKVQR